MKYRQWVVDAIRTDALTLNGFFSVWFPVSSFGLVSGL
jgi:hypothetical protein